MILDRRPLGAFGEEIAAQFLTDRGVDILARNLEVGRGELDLIGRLDGRPIVFEIRCRLDGDAQDGLDSDKIEQVVRLMRRLSPRVSRLDLVAVDIHPDRADVRWLPDVRSSRGEAQLSPFDSHQAMV